MAEEAVIIDEAIEELWTAFLAPPQVKLRSFIRQTLPSEFLEIYDHCRGKPTTDDESLKEAFKGCIWSPYFDPTYELPRDLMLELLADIAEENEQPTTEEIEANKKAKREQMEKNKAAYAEFKKEEIRANKLGRLVAKTEAAGVILKNTYK